MLHHELRLTVHEVKKPAIHTDSPGRNVLEEEPHIRDLKKRKMTEKVENKKYKGKDNGKGRLTEMEKLI